MNEFDDFDRLLKDKAHEEECRVPDSLNEKVDDILINLKDKRTYRNRSMKIAIAAALAAAISVSTVFAVGTPKLASMVNQVVSYFNNTKDTRYLEDKSSFEKFNKAVGVSAENKGIKLTVDNIAVDDNFINVFYTIESKTAINMDLNDENKLFEAVLSSPFMKFKINGKEIKYGNHNDTDAYFQGDKVLKVMSRINVSQITLPESFDLNISTDEIFRIKGKWDIATSIDKSAVSVASKTIEPNIKASISTGDIKHNINIKKVSISPFGSQIVIMEKTHKDNIFDKFALFDEKGNVLDVLNTDEMGSSFGKATNSFEFIKANANIKYITLVPIKFTESGKADVQKESILKLPAVFKTCNTGSRVVDNIKYDKNMIKIAYHNEGVELWDPAFLFYDSNGNELNLGDCGSSTSIDRQNGEYTQILSFGNKNPDFSKIAEIGTFTGIQHLELLKDQQIKIDLQK
jgi:hypothetical protein